MSDHGHEHHYQLHVRWTGNRGVGTATYTGYGRDHEVTAPGKPPIDGSSDTVFRGDATRWNPEELLVASLSQCHLLAYLHECVKAGISVVDYEDAPEGTMRTTADGGGVFTEVVLHPAVTVAEPGMEDLAQRLHDDAHHHCFIASSVNFPVRHEPVVRALDTAP